MKSSFVLLALLAAGAAHAETPRSLLDAYAADAARQTPGFQASAPRGAEFFRHRFGVSEKMPACVACHTEDPARPGRHVITGKDIKPLAPRANAARFTDAAKAEKWFGRNCGEVVGRPCSAAEKADLLRFLMEGA